MRASRKIDVFSAGCPACDEAVQQVQAIACPSCDVAVLDMRDAAVAATAKDLGVRSVPAIVIDGQLAECCSGRGPSEATLRAAGVGRPLPLDAVGSTGGTGSEGAVGGEDRAMERVRLSVSGMSCGGCVRHVTEAIAAVRGARVEDVTIGSATVSIDPNETSRAAVVKAVEAAGYEVKAELTA